MENRGLSTKFSHVKPSDTSFHTGGLRDFFIYRDLGVKDATSGRVIAQLVKANEAPEAGTGWHIHEAQFHIVYMLKGWARFMYEDQETLFQRGIAFNRLPVFVTFFLITRLTWSISRWRLQQILQMSR